MFSSAQWAIGHIGSQGSQAVRQGRFIANAIHHR